MYSALGNYAVGLPSAFPDVHAAETGKLRMVPTELNRHGTVADRQRLEAGQAS